MSMKFFFMINRIPTNNNKKKMPLKEQLMGIPTTPQLKDYFLVVTTVGGRFW